jgi:sulfur carrier protein ThiS
LETISVKIILSGLLRNQYRQLPSPRGENVELPEGSTVEDLLRRYKLTFEKASLLVVNRRPARLQTRLQSGDEVRVVPPAIGG